MIDCGYSNFVVAESRGVKGAPKLKLPKKVKLALIHHDTDLTKLAGDIGCSGPFLSMLLGGKRRSKKTLAALARLIGLAVAELQQEIPTHKGGPHVPHTTIPAAPQPSRRASAQSRAARPPLPAAAALAQDSQPLHQQSEVTP